MPSLRALILALAFATPEPLRAQVEQQSQASDPSQLSLRATRRDTIRAGATVTAAFLVTNARQDSVEVAPHVETPKDWTVLMGNAHLTVGGRSSAMLMLSVAIPARAATRRRVAGSRRSIVHR